MKLWPILAAGVIATSAVAQDSIIRDAEYRILERQRGEHWTAEYTAVDAKLAEFREKNGGKRPNNL